MIEIRNLSYEVETENGSVSILKNVNLSIDHQKFVVITGPNGSGKTTLAKAIMGLVKPSKGTIHFECEDITGRSITERARLGISYGFQHPPRFKGLRVIDLLETAAGKSFTTDECCHYLTRVGLCSKDYVEREIDAGLSGGELKRIEIASVLARNSRCMIFDEPEAGIDLWSFSQLTETFKRMQSEATATLIIISHQERIIDLADEIILIAGGEIREHGPKDEILPHLGMDTLKACCCREMAKPQ